MSEQKNNQNIQGDPLPLEDLLEFAVIDSEDLEYAAEWFDNHAQIDWVGVLDKEPLDDA